MNNFIKDNDNTSSNEMCQYGDTECFQGEWRRGPSPSPARTRSPNFPHILCACNRAPYFWDEVDTRARVIQWGRSVRFRDEYVTVCHVEGS